MFSIMLKTLYEYVMLACAQPLVTHFFDHSEKKSDKTSKYKLRPKTRVAFNKGDMLQKGNN